MNRVNTATPLLIIMIFLAVVTPLWLTLHTLCITKYGIILRFEGSKPVIDDKEICKDIVGNVIVKFGNEFQTINVCELINKRVIHVFFSKGVEYWIETLEELGIKPGMSAKEVIKTLESRGFGGVVMPTVSITFWLISEDVHYVANYVFTSMDYYALFGYSYFEAFNKMLEDPLAMVEEHATIIVRSEDLVRRFAVINMSRALDEVRKELNLSEPTSIQESHNLTTTQTTCPPGWQSMSTFNGVCTRKNYWNLPTTPPDWFSERILYYGDGNKSEVVQELWDRFLEGMTAYLFDKNIYPKPPDLGGISWKCGTDYVNIPIKMNTVVSYCLSERFNPFVVWNNTMTPDSEFTIYKPFVVTFVSSMSDIPPLSVLLTYSVTQKKTGFSIMGVPIFVNQEYFVNFNMKPMIFTSTRWEDGVRRVALIVPTYMKYLYDALIFTWNIRGYGAYVDGVFRRYWLAEPVPIITPYYEEIGWAPDSYWSACYYDASGNLMYGGISCSFAQNINNLINNMTGTFEKDYYVIKDTTFNNIPRVQELLDTSRFNTTEYGNLGSILFGIVKTLVVDLFLGNSSGSHRAFLLFLNFIDYEDTTFRGSVVAQRLWWYRGRESSNIPVVVQKMTKSGSYLSNNYGEIGKQPLVAEYIVIIGDIEGSSPT